jgi:hypothetical protein
MKAQYGKTHPRVPATELVDDINILNYKISKITTKYRFE